jgi:hypothetical protein
MTMQKGLGIAALVVAIIAIFIPFLGTWLTVLVAGLAIFAAGPGFGLAAASLVINVVHILFLSPLLWATSGLEMLADVAANSSGQEAPGAGFRLLPWILIGIQVAAFALLLKANKKREPSAVAESAT